MVDSILQADIENLETNGFSAATLINDTKRAVNEIIAQNGVLSVVPITMGGTGASTALQARTNLSAALDQLSSSSSKGLMSSTQFNKLARLIETVLRAWEPVVDEGVIDISQYPTSAAGRFYEVQGLVSPAYFPPFDRQLDNGDIIAFDLSGNPSDIFNTASLGIDDIYGLEDALYPQSKAGAEVEFTTPAFYGSVATPITSNITHDLVGAKVGVEVTIYHNDDIAPTFPTEWVLLGTGDYVTDSLNIVIARYIDSGRIEYVITQEA